MQDRGMGGWSATIILALIGFFNCWSKCLISISLRRINNGFWW
jgi:hypothetical protein